MKSDQALCRAVSVLDKLSDWVIKLLVLAAIVFAAYSIWDAGQIYEAADSAHYVAYRPTAGNDDPFAQLKKINPEVIAWLTVSGTRIDYPVTQAPNNTKYLSVNAEGKYATSGALFLDYRNSGTFDDFNSIIYGHHMEKDRMFGQLSEFGDERFFAEHPDAVLYYDGTYYDVAFFAFIQTDAYNRELFRPGIDGQAEREAYLRTVRSCALHSRELSVTPEDRLIVLTTCTSTLTNGRHMLLGKIMGKTQPDAESVSAPVNRGGGLRLSARAVRAVPLWAWAAADLLLILALAIVWFVLRGRHRAGEAAQER